MPIFRQEKEKILVDCYAVDVFIPPEYIGSEYRGTSYYSIIGTQVKYFAGMCNFRYYKNEKEFNNPSSVSTYVLGVPTTFISKPSEIDTRDVQFTKSGPIRKRIVLTFYRNDKFLCNVNTIANTAHMMIMLLRIQGGKIDGIPPQVLYSIVRDGERMNYMNLRISNEELQAFLSERYRDPDNPSKKLRHAKNPKYDADHTVSYRMREDAMQTTTFQAFTHEDINNSLITSINRKQHGIINEPTAVERIVRGMDIEPLVEEGENASEEEAPG